MAVYLRASQDRDGTGLSVDRQREDVQRLCDSRGWTIAEEFVDNDVSALSRKPRPAFVAMMARVDAGDFDVICARHMDRLLRRLAELESVLERCAATGTAIVTASDGVDTATDGGRLVARILSSVAQGEVERKGARQRSAVVQAAKQGRWVGGRRAFGYEADGKTIRDTEAEQVRRGYAAITSGESLGEVARRWTAAGYPTPRGTVWNRSSVKDVLTNPRNAGLRRHRTAEERANADIRANPEVGIVGKAEWPAIVDEATWRKAVRILCHPARRKKQGAKGLLSGVAMCAVCEETVVRSSGESAPVYRCKSMRHISRRVDPIDEWVEEVALAALSKPGAAALWSTVDVTEALARADDLRTQLAELDEDYARMPRDRWRAINDRLQAELADAESQLSVAAPDAPIVKVATAKNPRKVFKALTIPQRRNIIDTIMEVRIHSPGRGNRTFNRDTVVCTPKEPK